MSKSKLNLKIDLGELGDTVDIAALEKDTQKYVDYVLERHRNGHYRAASRRLLEAQGVRDDLKKRGYFVRGEDRRYWFREADRRLLEIGGFEMQAYLSDQYQVNAAETLYRFLVNELDVEAYSRGKPAVVRQLASWDEASKVLYIDAWNGNVYRLNGDTTEVIPNGSEGPLFLPIQGAAPYTIVRGEDGLLQRLILDQVNFEQEGLALLEPQQQKMLLSCAFYAPFFEERLPTKPLILFYGPKRSGKTYTSKAIGTTLFGPSFNVQTVFGQDDFRVTISANRLAAFDNVDGRIKWLNDALATASTGQLIRLRRLYTTNDEAIYHPHCFIILTARDPRFRREDVAERLLIFKTQRLDRIVPEHRLLRAIVESRNALWGEILADLSLIVTQLKENREPPISSIRLADFFDFAWQVAETGGHGHEIAACLDVLSQEQSEFALEDESIYVALVEWLADEDNRRREVTTSALRDSLANVAAAIGISWPYEDTRWFGKRLAALEEDLRRKFDLTNATGHGRVKTWKFDLRR